MCISAAGQSIPIPTVILPLQNLPTVADEVYESFHFAGSESGWINEPLWSSWIRDSFIPYVNETRTSLLTKNQHFKPPQFGRALLILDSHASRLDEAAHLLLEANGVVCVSIPAHTSHILQPLDNGVNNHFKHCLRNWAFLKYITMDAGLAEYRSSLLVCVKSAYLDACNFLRVRSAWATCGLWPWNPRVLLRNPSKVTPSTAVPRLPEKPTALQNISGKVVTSDIIISHRKQREAEERIKKEAKDLKEKQREEKKVLSAAK